MPSVSKKAHTGTTATPTFTANHSIPVGATVTVALSPPDSAFDGTFTVTAMAAKAISYINAAATVASTSSGGTVTDITTADANDTDNRWHLSQRHRPRKTDVFRRPPVWLVTTPYSVNAEAPWLRAFYNSLFFNGNAVAKLDLTYSPATYPQDSTTPLSVSITNTGAGTAVNVTNVQIMMSPGFTYNVDNIRPTAGLHCRKR